MAAAAAAAAAAVASSINIIVFGSAPEGCVIILKSSWSKVKSGVLHRGIVLEREVPLGVVTGTAGEYMLRLVGLITPDGIPVIVG